MSHYLLFSAGTFLSLNSKLSLKVTNCGAYVCIKEYFQLKVCNKWPKNAPDFPPPGAVTQGHLSLPRCPGMLSRALTTLLMSDGWTYTQMIWCVFKAQMSRQGIQAKTIQKDNGGSTVLSFLWSYWATSLHDLTHSSNHFFSFTSNSLKIDDKLLVIKTIWWILTVN